jgi:hypothetical protein
VACLYVFRNCSAKLAAMDERALKRLLIIVAIGIAAIFIFKSMMSKTIINLNKVAVEKKQTSATQPVPQPDILPTASDSVTLVDVPAASGVGEVSMLETPAASAVSDAR